MKKFYEVLSGQERYNLRKKTRMNDIMRGISDYNISFWSERGVVYQHVFYNEIRVIKCYNHNKYISVFGNSKKSYLKYRSCMVTINEELIGIVCLDTFAICKFLPNKKYECLDEKKICEILNQALELEGTTLRYSCLSDADKCLWIEQHNAALFKEHLKFDDDFIAGLWRKMNIPLTKQQLMEYRDVIYRNHDVFSSEQKEKIAKEIVFYIVPQYISAQSDEEKFIIQDLCRFVMNEYEISTESEWDVCKLLPQLKERFLIHSLEKAKEYYIANGCSLERYKDCCLDVDYDEIMDSFEQWDISLYEAEWTQEAIERCFVAEGIYKDWNVERILDLITKVKVDVCTFTKLKKYISDHIDEIYVREVPVCHIRELMEDNIYDGTIQELLEECCGLLQGFESRKFNLEEEETFRRIQNRNELLSASFYYVNDKKKVVVMRDTTRIREPRDPYEPRYEWSPKVSDPRIFSLWGEEGLIGKLEVVEYHIIWNVMGKDKEKIFKLFSEYVRNLEIIPPEKEIRYATEEESARWNNETILSCIENQNFFGNHSEWFVGTGQSPDVRLMKSIVSELKKHENITGVPNFIWLCLIGYIIPSIKDNPLLCTQKELDYISDFLKKTSKNVIGQEIAVKKNTPDMLLATYQPYCMVNTLDSAKEFCMYFFCNKSKYRNGKVFFCDSLFYENVWNSFCTFDITGYEREWIQEVFDTDIDNSCDPCYALDLLEKVGTFENYKKFIDVSEKYWNKEYVYIRLKKMYQNLSEENTRVLVKDFCETLLSEIEEGRKS